MRDGEKLAADKKLIRDAMSYRSGNDSCGSFYMGSMATAGLYHALGLRYGEAGFDSALATADRPTTDKVMAKAKQYVDYMLAHPVKRCECCGQIVSDGGVS